MRKQEVSGWSTFFTSRLFIVFILIAIIFLVFTLIRSYFQERQIKEEVNRLKKEASLLETKKFETLEILKYVQSPQFAEEKARTEFNMQKIGEQLVIIKGGSDVDISSRQDESKVIEYNAEGNSKKWWRLFTNY